MSILNERDARTKWCPFARYVSGEEDNEGAANRWSDFTNPTLCRCIASDCMMWQEVRPRVGYCGLTSGERPLSGNWYLTQGK
jgi:hypothetical protein